jgi:hypothetical protein
MIVMGRLSGLIALLLVVSCVRQGFGPRSVAEHEWVHDAGVSDFWLPDARTDGPLVLEFGADIPSALDVDDEGGPDAANALLEAGADIPSVLDADGEGVADSLLPDTPTADASANPSVLFVTTAVYRPGIDFHGIVDADKICLQASKKAQLKGTILALLSDTTTNAATRATLGYPVKTTNGDVIAVTDLFSGAGILNRIRDEGGALSTNSVWTGSNEYGVNPNGSSVIQHCNNWTNWQTTHRGKTGVASSTGTNWLGNSSIGAPLCNNSAALYCVSVP